MNKPKTLVLLAAVVAVGITFGARVSFARDIEENPWELGVQAGGVFVSDDETDTEIQYSGRLTYDLMPYFALGVEGGWVSYDVELNNQDWGDLHGFPIMGNAIVKYPIPQTDDQLVPYALAGVGVIVWNFDESQLLKDNGVSVDSKTKLAYKVGGGLDYFFSPNVAIFAEGSYTWSEYEAEVSAAGAVAAGEVDYDHAYAGGGIKFRF